jgi:NADPH:quinone reductase-like Zn-dependent oxidoreductase
MARGTSPVACYRDDMAEGRMRAAIRTGYGRPADVVRIADVDRPEAVDDQVRVRVHAASVNRADLDGIEPRPGFLRLFLGLRRPRDPRIGIDVAGVVDAVGPAVTRFRVGDRVFADLYPSGGGAFAEMAVAPQRVFERMPDGLSFEDAATLPHSAILALQGLRRRDGRTPGPGDRVLIGGASGNVGPFAVQLAKSYGAQVTGVCRGAKVDFVRSLGVDHVIDYETVDYAKTGERYDWIVEADSHHSMLELRRALRPGGIYVTLGGNGRDIAGALLQGPVVSLATSKSLGLLLSWKPFHPPDVATLAAMVVAGTLRPQVDRRFSLEEAVEALTYVAEGRNRGKVLVIP